MSPGPRVDPAGRRPPPDEGFRDADRRHMRRALELARRGWGWVAPNPLVGAVLVRDEEVVGEGWHGEFGGAHAEVKALAEAGEAAEGATLYVTLEPCDHAGKTPPCTRALLDAGVARVVAACPDPGGEAAGGAETLREAGVRVEVGVLGEEAARLNAPFFWSAVGDRPFVSLKLALSLDARIAQRPGVRTPLTGPEAEAWVHGLRAGHGAIVVGRTTAAVDDPRLTVRGSMEPRKPPLRVVLDSSLALSPEARLVATASEVPTWLFGAPGAPDARRERLEESGVRVEETPADPDGPGLRLEPVLARLGAEEVSAVLVEGGGKLAASFLQERMVERLHLLYAPVLLGEGGVPGFPGTEAPDRRWHVAERRRLGRDTLITLESPRLREVLERAV